MAAWLAHGAAPPYSDRDDGTYEHLAKFYEDDVYGDTATRDSHTAEQDQPVVSTASKRHRKREEATIRELVPSYSHTSTLDDPGHGDGRPALAGWHGWAVREPRAGWTLAASPPSLNLPTGPLFEKLGVPPRERRSEIARDSAARPRDRPS